MKTITIGLVQMRCERGAIYNNLASIYANLQAGMSQGVDIMCFPEMSITGYINPPRPEDHKISEFQLVRQNGLGSPFKGRL